LIPVVGKCCRGNAWTKFNNNATLVKDFAQENISYHDLIVALGIVEPPEEEEYDEPDYEDYI